MGTYTKDDGARPWAGSIPFALVLVLTFALLRTVQTHLWGYWFGSTDLQETLFFVLFMLGSFAVLSVGFVGGGVVWLTRTPWRGLGWRRVGVVKAIAWGLLGFVGVCVNLLVWNLIGGATSRPDYASPSAGRLLIVTFFAFGVAAWVEENLFRGYLQPLLARRFPLLVAITAQAAVFSVAHIGYTTSPIVFGSAFVSGVILGALRGRDRSLVAPYVAHSLLWMMALFGPAPT